MCARYGAEHQDQDRQPEDRCGAVLQKLDADVVGGELGSSDARTDDDRDEKPGAEKFGKEPAADRVDRNGRRYRFGIGHLHILTQQDNSVKLDSMNIERTVLEARAARHAVLADVARLAVIDELALGDRSPSELQKILDLPSNLMTHHLNVLEGAGMIARRRSEGDRRRSYVTLVDYSMLEPHSMGDIRVGRVVFVCSANSARSQLAAALWNRSSDVPVASAGGRCRATQPQARRDRSTSALGCRRFP